MLFLSAIHNFLKYLKKELQIVDVKRSRLKLLALHKL